MPLGKLCIDCGEWTSAPVEGRCEDCAPLHLARGNARRAAHPRRLIYEDPRWQPCRQRVFARDGHECVDCGRGRGELAENERLLCDHIDGIRAILDRGGDPFDEGECATRCSTCSGRKDGGRR